MYKFTGTRYEKLLPVTLIFGNSVGAVMIYLPSDHPKSRKSILFEPQLNDKHIVTRFQSVRAVSGVIAKKLGHQVIAYILKKRGQVLQSTSSSRGLIEKPLNSPPKSIQSSRSAPGLARDSVTQWKFSAPSLENLVQHSSATSLTARSKWDPPQKTDTFDGDVENKDEVNDLQTPFYSNDMLEQSVKSNSPVRSKWSLAECASIQSSKATPPKLNNETETRVDEMDDAKGNDRCNTPVRSINETEAEVVESIDDKDSDRWNTQVNTCTKSKVVESIDDKDSDRWNTQVNPCTRSKVVESIDDKDSDRCNTPVRLINGTEAKVVEMVDARDNFRWNTQVNPYNESKVVEMDDAKGKYRCETEADVVEMDNARYTARRYTQVNPYNEAKVVEMDDAKDNDRRDTPVISINETEAEVVEMDNARDNVRWSTQVNPYNESKVVGMDDAKGNDRCNSPVILINGTEAKVVEMDIARDNVRWSFCASPASTCSSESDKPIETLKSLDSPIESPILELPNKHFDEFKLRDVDQQDKWKLKQSRYNPFIQNYEDQSAPFFEEEATNHLSEFELRHHFSSEIATPESSPSISRLRAFGYGPRNAMKKPPFPYNDDTVEQGVIAQRNLVNHFQADSKICDTSSVGSVVSEIDQQQLTPHNDSLGSVAESLESSTLTQEEKLQMNFEKLEFMAEIRRIKMTVLQQKNHCDLKNTETRVKRGRQILAGIEGTTCDDEEFQLPNIHFSSPVQANSPLQSVTPFETRESPVQRYSVNAKAPNVASNIESGPDSLNEENDGRPVVLEFDMGRKDSRGRIPKRFLHNGNKPVRPASAKVKTQEKEPQNDIFPVSARLNRRDEYSSSSVAKEPPKSAWDYNENISSNCKIGGSKSHDDKTETKSSNILLISNAITHVCLAGLHHTKKREAVLESMKRHVGGQFVVVFRNEVALKFRGVYKLLPSNELEKVFGPKSLPDIVHSTMIESFFKYNTGQKSFVQMSSKTFSKTTDAVSLHAKCFSNSSHPMY